MLESRRDAGLVRAIGVRGLATSTINAMVGAGIFVTPGALAACMGRSAPIAFVLCAIAMGAVTICFAEGGSRVATSGGAYGVIEAAFGPLAGYIAGSLLWLSDALTSGISAALGDVVVSVVPQPFKAPTHMMVIIGVIGAVVVVNLGGVRRGVRLVDWVTTVKMIPLFLFLVVGVIAIHRANFVQSVPSGAQGLGRALILVLFLLTGMEVSLSASGEVKQPSRHHSARPGDYPLLRHLPIHCDPDRRSRDVGCFSCAIRGPTGRCHGARISPVLRMVMIAGASVSMMGWIASDLLSRPRILFAFGRDGLLPQALGRVHPRTHAPHVAILCYAALAMGLALTGSFVELAVLATLAVTVLYAAGSVAAWRLARDGVAQNGVPLNFRGLTAAMVVATTSMVIFFAMGSRAEILGVLAVIGGVSGTIYVLQTRLALAPAKL